MWTSEGAWEQINIRKSIIPNNLIKISSQVHKQVPYRRDFKSIHSCQQSKNVPHPKNTAEVGTYGIC